jgi:predicted ferric reductase
MGTLTWYVARAGGLVTWGLLLATVTWGLLLATRVLGRHPTPAWLLSLHRYLGALTLAFLGVHVGAILLDSFTSFSLVNVLVPFTGTWHPTAVAWGIIAMYLLVAIEITSLVRHRMSNRAWHAVHLTAYFVFGLSTVHMVTAGTDVKAVVASSLSVLVATAAVFGSAAMYVWRRNQPTGRRAARRAHLAAAARQPSMHAPRNTSATSTNVGARS